MKLRGKIKKIVFAGLIALNGTACASVIYASQTNPDKLQFFIKAMEYALMGLEKYFDFIIKLFTKALTI